MKCYVYWREIDFTAIVFNELNYHDDYDVEKAFIEYREFGSHPNVCPIEDFKDYKKVLGYKYIRNGRVATCGGFDDIVKYLLKGKEKKRVVRQLHKHLAGETATLYKGQVEKVESPINLAAIEVKLL